MSILLIVCLKNSLFTPASEFIMPLRLKSQRKFKYVRKVPGSDEEYSVTFEHTFAEDEDTSVLQEALRDIPENISEEERQHKIEEITQLTGMKMYMNRFRKSLVEWEDIEDENGKPYEFNEYNQKLIFEYVHGDAEFFKEIVADKKAGVINSKNSKAGVTRS